jgi:hypothetical protein
MPYECLIHLPTATFCGARTPAQIAAGNVWSAAESDPRGEFGLFAVDVPAEGNEPLAVGPCTVLPSQVDGRGEWLR